MSDNDFDFDEQDEGKQKVVKIENAPYDEAVNLSEGSDIPSQEEKGQDQQQQAHDQYQDNDQDLYQTRPLNSAEIKAGYYNPQDYEYLMVSQEIKDLFKHIKRFQPEQIEIESKLKPFIPEYICAVGEVDAFLKMERADNKQETLGLVTLDEPALNQTKRAKADLMLNEFMTKKKQGSQNVHAIHQADKNPKEILGWINDVAEIRKHKQAPQVTYSKPMPDIDALMQVWPSEFEDILQTIQLPGEDLDLSVEDYAKLACTLLDIPVHSSSNGNDKNIIESLHVFFTLYSEFKANQHFQQQNEDAHDQNTLQINN